MALQVDHDRQARLQSALQLSAIDEIHCFISLSSTNDHARDLVKSEHKKNIVILAQEQSAGRGRLQRAWLSPKGGLYLTLLIKKSSLPKKPCVLAMLPALAAIETLKSFNINATCKWPNDIIVESKNTPLSLPYFLHFRKIGGVLIENFFENNLHIASAMGLGINFKVQETLNKNVPHAITLEELSKKIDEEEFTQKLISTLDQFLGKMGDSKEEGEMIALYQKSCQTLGRRVSAKVGEEFIEGLAESIGEDGSLKVRTGDKICTISAGDVNFSE